jgi:mono/diheme cytochrome c family protein
MPFRLLGIPFRAAMVAALFLAGGMSPLFAEDARLDEGQFDLGRQVFTEIAQPACGLCHTLENAGTSGAIGPSLDTMNLTEGQVRAAVEQGVGVMPPFADKLEDDEIDAVVAYVMSATGG